MLLFLAMCITLCRFIDVEARKERLHPLSNEFIDRINAKQNLWRAGSNFHRQTPINYFKRLMGTLIDNSYDYLPRVSYRNVTKNPPKNFDGRRYWPGCPTLNDVRDQGACGSCWAIATVSAMTDRVCITSKGSTNFYFSAEDVLSCCTNCGLGCDGGILSRAWLYYKGQGVVSGGGFESNQGCKPYEIAPCEHNVPGKRADCGSYLETPNCNKSCESSYNVKYKKDKKRGRSVYAISKVRNIKNEIFRFGPVTTYFNVYSDFLVYKNGTYKHVKGEYLGDHSVKIIGWGEENGVRYWLAANSWNTDWGDNGFFKIIRGINHCGFESHVVAGK